MPISKVNFGGQTLMDISEDSVTPETLLEGETAHDKTGTPIQGRAVIPTSVSDLSGGTFAGQVKANTSGQSPSVYVLRNQKISLTDENPAVNGEICWVAE